MWSLSPDLAPHTNKFRRPRRRIVSKVVNAANGTASGYSGSPNGMRYSSLFSHVVLPNVNVTTQAKHNIMLVLAVIHRKSWLTTTAPDEATVFSAPTQRARPN